MFTVRAIARALALAVGLAITGLVAVPAAQAAPRATVVLNPGDPIYSDAGACVASAYVTDGTADYLLTAAACAQFGDSWYADAAHDVPVGTLADGGSPGQGALIALVPGVGPQQVFTNVGNAFVGETVCLRSGTAVRCGTVQAVNVTVTTPYGIYQHLIQANVCTTSGSPALGAPLYDAGTLLGIQPFDEGTCGSGGEYYFQPVIDIFESEGLSLS